MCFSNVQRQERGVLLPVRGHLRIPDHFPRVQRVAGNRCVLVPELPSRRQPRRTEGTTHRPRRQQAFARYRLYTVLKHRIMIFRLSNRLFSWLSSPTDTT